MSFFFFFFSNVANVCQFKIKTQNLLQINESHEIYKNMVLLAQYITKNIVKNKFFLSPCEIKKFNKMKFVK